MPRSMRAAAASSAAAGVRALRRGRESSAAPATHGEAPQPQLLACYWRRWASKLIFQALSLSHLESRRRRIDAGICAPIPHAIVHLLLREASNSRYRGSKQAKQVLVLYSSLLLSFLVLSYPIAKLCSFLPLPYPIAKQTPRQPSSRSARRPVPAWQNL